jgi:hypothetical protein
MANLAGRRHGADQGGDGEDISGLNRRRHHPPLKIVANETSFTTLLITNTFIPAGG